MRDIFKRILADDAVFYGGLVILVSISSFGLGRLSVEEERKTAPTVTMQQSAVIQSNTSETTEETVRFVASKNGTKYHASWCPGANQIKEENKLFFTSSEEAESQGYSLAANCEL